MFFDISSAEIIHSRLSTTFVGIKHPISTKDVLISQFRGLKYASIPARFRQSVLCTSYPPVTDLSRYGPVCPQEIFKSLEEDMFGLSQTALPTQSFKQNEFECLNLNITCPAGLSPDSRLPVMIWIHGGGDRGSGSSWVFDGGALVRKSILLRKPVIIVNFNFRIGLLGFAASPALREDNNKLAGVGPGPADDTGGGGGVGNYGLWDQIRAFEWVHHFIADFGGDPSNVTLFGQSSGAADIICHLFSSENDPASSSSPRLFHRAIVQSPVFDYNLPDVHTAGCHLSRIMSALRVSSLEQLRAVDPDRLVKLGMTMRATDDGVFFRKGWKECILGRFTPNSTHHHRQGQKQVQLRLQPLIIGDCAFDSLLWSFPASCWTAPGVVRRLKAVCQSLAKASALQYAYDISPHSTPEELVQGVLELINDARVAWPTECVAQAAMGGGGGGVWRYVFDQEGPARGVPHHAADLVYLFDNMPLPTESLSMSALPLVGTVKEEEEEEADEEEAGEAVFCESFGFDEDEEDEELGMKFPSGNNVVDHEEEEEDGDGDGDWAIPHVDAWSYARVKDAMQERWIAFACGESPWSEDKVFVFGPEGETGERSASIFDGRRRRAVWEEVLEPLGMALVQKVGIELSRGPPLVSSSSSAAAAAAAVNMKCFS